MGELIDAKEVAKAQECQEKTVYTYAKMGKLPFIELDAPKLQIYQRRRRRVFAETTEGDAER